MTTVSVQTLQRIAGETGYAVQALEKVLRLLQLLREISHDPDLNERFALKGGTALNVFYLGLDRLSVDIDLNYVGALEVERMQTDRPEMEALLSRLLVSLEYDVRRQPVSHAGGKWILRFASALGGDARLEVDVNYMARQPLFGANRMSSVDIGGVQASGVLVLDLHEIVAGKLVALLDRCTGRDLFDARRILSINDLDWARVKVAVLAYGACSRRDWRRVSFDTIQYDPLAIRQNLLICLPAGYFASTDEADSWITNTIELCQERLAFLFELTINEQAFLDGVLDRGEINADLLDIEPEIQARIATMPMLAWKCQHVRGYRASS